MVRLRISVAVRGWAGAGWRSDAELSQTLSPTLFYMSTPISLESAAIHTVKVLHVLQARIASTLRTTVGVQTDDLANVQILTRARLYHALRVYWGTAPLVKSRTVALRTEKTTAALELPAGSSSVAETFTPLTFPPKRLEMP